MAMTSPSPCCIEIDALSTCLGGTHLLAEEPPLGFVCGPGEGSSIVSTLQGANSIGEGFLAFFTGREACVLRLVCRELLEAVDVAPFDASAASMPRISRDIRSWRECFPSARAVDVSFRADLTDADFFFLFGSGRGAGIQRLQMKGCTEASPAMLELLGSVRALDASGCRRLFLGATQASLARSLRSVTELTAAEALSEELVLDILRAPLKGPALLSPLFSAACSQEAPTRSPSLLAYLSALESVVESSMSIPGCFEAIVGSPLFASLSEGTTLPLIERALGSANVAIRLAGVTALRKMLSKDANSPIDAIMAAGFVPTLLRELEPSSESPTDIQLEALWALTNVASGDSRHTQALVDAGAVPIFVPFLLHDEVKLREQASWALGNLSGESASLRNLVVGSGALLGMLASLHSSTPLPFLRTLAWSISNLLRWKPLPLQAALEQIAFALAQLVYSDDSDVIIDALWGLSYMTDGDAAPLQVAVETGAMVRVCDLLCHKDAAVLTPALRVTGNVVSGDEVLTQVMINCGCLQGFAHILLTGTTLLTKEACWALSNICAGSTPQLAAVIEAGILPVLVGLCKSAPIEVRREACCALSNATSSCDNVHLMAILQAQGLEAMSEVLRLEIEASAGADAISMMFAIEGFENILRAAPSVAEMSRTNSTHLADTFVIDACRGGNVRLPHRLMALMESGNISGGLYAKCAHLIDSHFPDAEADNGEGDDPEEGGP